jgi:hypothetical protein
LTFRNFDDAHSIPTFALFRCQNLWQEATKQNGTDVYVVVYNGLAQSRSSIVHLPVSSKAMYSVEEIGGDNSTIQAVQAIPTLRVTKLGGAPYRVAFMAAKVPPLGASVYKVSVSGIPPLGASVYKVSVSGISRVREIKSQLPEAARTSRISSGGHEEPDVIASNEYYSVTFDG